MTLRISAALLAATMSALLSQAVTAADVDPCTRFTWDVTHELAVMKQSPQPITAASQPGAEVPTLQVDKLYELKLTSQSGVTFAITPGKPTLPDSAQAGLAQFRSAQAGRYRVAITSGHWIDVVDGKALVQSRDFQGARGCQRPHKIVEYELPADRALTLQLSGAADSTVVLAITAVQGRTLHR